MAIPFVRLEYVQRSGGRTICQKSAYIGRMRVEFEGNKVLSPTNYDWSHREQSLHHAILLPDHVDKSFLDPTTLWNSVEKFENRKDAQVGIDVVLALPDDAVITQEQRIKMAEDFAIKHFVSKGYGVQLDVHQPSTRTQYDEEDGNLSIIEKNNHAHLLVTPRHFSADGLTFSSKKINDLGPKITQVKGKNQKAYAALEWEKIWTQDQNETFENLGLDLRVDQPGLLSQIHLGAYRLRGKNSHELLEINQNIIDQNKANSIEPKTILEILTEKRSIFTSDDLETLLKKIESHYLIDGIQIPSIEAIKSTFWQSPDIVQLLDKDTQVPQEKYTSLQVIEEEQKIFRLADAINQRPSYLTRVQPNSSDPDHYLSTLNTEQLAAFEQLTQGQALSCLEGLAGTGKSYLLFALKKHYEANGYKVRAFGPDNTTVKVLEQKGFTDARSIHYFLFKNRFAKKNKITPKNEVWIIDESSKLANKPLLELLKTAEENRIQLIFSGNSAQLNSVERGGMFPFFSDRFGHAYLKEVQRQHFPIHREVVKHLATQDKKQRISNISKAIDLISKTGGFTWTHTREDAVIAAVNQWASDKLNFPYSNTLIIAHTNHEVTMINDLIHTVRMVRGEVSKQEFHCQGHNGPIRVSEGDLIEFRENSPAVKVHNGEVGVLVSATEKKFTIQIKDRKVSFNPQKFSAFQLAYAVTYFRSQGHTVDRAIIIYSRHMTQKLMYIGESRHVRNIQCYVPFSEAANLAVIKHQLTKEIFDKNTLSYTHAQEVDKRLKIKKRKQSIQDLCQSPAIGDKAKGYGFRLFDSIKTNIESLVEKVQDRRPDGSFYKTPEKPTQNGFVPKKEEFKLMNNPTQDTPEKSSPQPKSPAFQQLSPEQKDFFKNCFQKSEDAAALYDVVTSNEKPPSEKSSDKPSPKSAAFQKLSPEHKTLFKTYFQKSEEAAALYAIVKAESASESAPSFKEWQSACAWRNRAAFELLRGGSLHKAILGEKGHEILQDQVARYEKSLQPKDSLLNELKENLDHLLYKLFPDGPQRRDARGYRFGNKGSLAVTGAGEKKGSFWDFEKQEGGGPLKLIEKKLGLNPAEAKTWATEFLKDAGKGPAPAHFSTSHFKAPKFENWIGQSPPNAPPPLSKLSRYLDTNYKMTALYPYHTPTGEVVFYSMRLEPNNGEKKIVLPLSYGKSHAESEPHWNFKRPSNAPLIYNAHELLRNPQKLVLIVEGEKTADAASKLFSSQDIVTITFTGGAGAVFKANWEQIMGRNVVIWPDNDQAGSKAAQDLVSELRKHGANSIKVVDQNVLQKHFPEKWDLADDLPAGITQNHLKDMLFSANEKTFGLNSFLSQASLLNKDFDPNQPSNIFICREILSRITQQRWEALEGEWGGKTWEIKAAIQEEALNLLSTMQATQSKISMNFSQEHSQVIAFGSALFLLEQGREANDEELQKLKTASLQICQIAKQHSSAENEQCLLRFMAVVPYIGSKHMLYMRDDSKRGFEKLEGYVQIHKEPMRRFNELIGSVEREHVGVSIGKQSQMEV